MPSHMDLSIGAIMIVSMVLLPGPRLLFGRSCFFLFVVYVAESTSYLWYRYQVPIPLRVVTRYSVFVSLGNYHQNMLRSYHRVSGQSARSSYACAIYRALASGHNI